MSKLKNRRPLSSCETRRIKEPIYDSSRHRDGKILFSFQHLEKKYCISLCERDDKAAMADQLRALGGMTWNEIHQSPRHGLGCEKIKRSAIKPSIPAHITEDVNFYSFRFSGKKPMIGYGDREVFHIIWIDRDFSVYKHG